MTFTIVDGPNCTRPRDGEDGEAEVGRKDAVAEEEEEEEEEDEDDEDDEYEDGEDSEEGGMHRRRFDFEPRIDRS